MRAAALVATLLLCAVASAGKLSPKELTMNLDYFDICIGTDCWDLKDNAGEMERLMATCAHYGVDRILFRVSVCGSVCYRSKAMYVAQDASFKGYEDELLDTAVGDIPSLIPRMARVMDDIDPLAECVKYGHKYGIKVWGWSTIYDSMYYSPPDEFFQRHPEYTWVSKDGTKHVPGVPCYAYPEVRALRLAEVKEMLGYGVDGIYLCMRSHSPWPGRGTTGGNEGARGYGFNEPVVREYIRRYGKDPREAKPDSLDEIRFVKLKGDFLKQFLKEAHAETMKAGVPLAMNTDPSGADPIAANWMYIPADDLVREHVIDELSVLAAPSYDFTRYRLLADNKIKCTTFPGIHGRTYDSCLEQLRSGMTAMLNNPTSDGACFHELANVTYLNLWEDGILGPVREWKP